AGVRSLDQHARGIQRRAQGRLREVGQDRARRRRADRLMAALPRHGRAPEGVPDSRGLNLFDADPSYRGLLELHLEPKLCAHLMPHFAELGSLAGADLDALALDADKNPPTLLDSLSVQKSNSYKQLEQFAFGKYGLAA